MPDAPPGYAPEYVEGIWLMLQQEAPCDPVFGTGETHPVLEFVEETFSYVNLDWREYVAEDPRYLCSTEVPLSSKLIPPRPSDASGGSQGSRFGTSS